MTTVPARYLFKLHHHKGYGSSGHCYKDSFGLMNQITGYDCCRPACFGSDLVVFDRMAEDESRTNSLNQASSSSKDVQDEKDETWLQLGIGGGDRDDYVTSGDNKLDPLQPTTQRSEFVELDLLTGGSTRHVKPLAPIAQTSEFRAPRPVTDIPSAATSFSQSFHWQYPRTSSSLPQPEFIWGYGPNPWNIMASSSSSMPSGSNFVPPFQVYPGVDSASPSSDYRIIDVPRRPHSGIWFVLQASQNQAKEPFLPQIPKSYLRIKDGRMTVRLLMKYLAKKLRLDSESEIEMRCKGQELLPFLTLQHVRDNIWSSRDAVTLLSHESSTSDHVMILHYARRG